MPARRPIVGLLACFIRLAPVFLYFQDISLENLTEVRKILEPYIAGQAARMMTPERTRELIKVHEECETLYKQDKPLVGAEAEVKFHVLLAKYTNNHILWIMLDFINNTIADIKLQIKPGRDFCYKVLVAHRKILEAILAARSADASKYMYEHICEVGDELNLLITQRALASDAEKTPAARPAAQCISLAEFAAAPSKNHSARNGSVRGT